MSLRLTNMGGPAVQVYPPKHSLAGLPVEPLGWLSDGTPVWPVAGAAPDDEDPDDPEFTGQDDDESDDDDSDEDEKDTKSKRRRPRQRKPNRTSQDDDESDDEDDDDEDELPARARASRQAMRYRRQLRETQDLLKEVRRELKGYRDKDKKPEELTAEELREAREKADRLTARQQEMALENAFLKSNVVDWEDPEDALRLVDLSDVDVDDDGTVDRKALRAALRDLARRKPHLVKKSKVRDQDEDDDDTDDDEEPRPSRPARMNGKRKGERSGSDREALSKKFPVLNRL